MILAHQKPVLESSCMKASCFQDEDELLPRLMVPKADVEPLTTLSSSLCVSFLLSLVSLSLSDFEFE